MYIDSHCETQHTDQKYFSKNETNRHPVCLMPDGAMLSLTGKAEDSPGPDPAPEPELLPSDLSSDWPTGGEGGMVNMKIREEKGVGQ